MHRILVYERNDGEERFLSPRAQLCMLLPDLVHSNSRSTSVVCSIVRRRLHRRGSVRGPRFHRDHALSFLYILLGIPGSPGPLFRPQSGRPRDCGFRLSSASAAVPLKTRTDDRTRSPFLAIFLFNAPFPADRADRSRSRWTAGKRAGSGFRAAGGQKCGCSGLSDADSLLGEALPDHGSLSCMGLPDRRDIHGSCGCFDRRTGWHRSGTANVFVRISIFFSPRWRSSLSVGPPPIAVLANVAPASLSAPFIGLQPCEMLNGLGNG